MVEAVITIKERKLMGLIRQVVTETIQGLLADPDGLVLKKSFEKDLEKSIESKKTGRVIAFSDILKKYQF